jgi:hypothetical protein
VELGEKQWDAIPLRFVKNLNFLFSYFFEVKAKKSEIGLYKQIILQHHDQIVTASDMGLAVACQYDLTNKSVSNEVDLGVVGDLRNSITQESIVDSPNVAMRVTDRRGESTGAAQVNLFYLIAPLSHIYIFAYKLSPTFSKYRLETRCPSVSKLWIPTAPTTFSSENLWPWMELMALKLCFLMVKVAPQIRE